MPPIAITPMSMTGFARSDGEAAGYRVVWELRSVNGKGLDIRLRLPPGYDDLEPLLRQRLGAALVRGNVQATLSLTRAESSAAGLRVNEAALRDVVALLRRLKEEIPHAAPPTLDGILATRGVLETADDISKPETDTELRAAMLGLFDDTLASMREVRAREGAALAAILSARLDDLERLAAAAEQSPARTPDAIRARLAEQVAALMSAAPTLDPTRLHQEAVLLATKADIREELDRLGAHIAAARALLAKGAPVGRQLDFLAQEFNREANTLCSKANDAALTAIGLEMKVAIDQLREQVQNLE